MLSSLLPPGLPGVILLSGPWKGRGFVSRAFLLFPWQFSSSLPTASPVSVITAHAGQSSQGRLCWLPLTPRSCCRMVAAEGKCEESVISLTTLELHPPHTETSFTEKVGVSTKCYLCVRRSYLENCMLNRTLWGVQGQKIMGKSPFLVFTFLSEALPFSLSEEMLSFFTFPVQTCTPLGEIPVPSLQRNVWPAIWPLLKPCSSSIPPD